MDFFQEDGNNFLRVREIIRHLNYGELTKKKIIPSTPLFVKIPTTNIFKKIPEKFGYSKFGLFMEDIIELSLSKTIEKEKVCQTFLDTIPVKKYDTKELSKFISVLQKHFYSVENIKFRSEFNIENISGHPDLITDDTIYEIKTTSFFNKMRVDTILQMLSYFALGNILYEKKYKKIGLILPSQSLILTVNLENWDYTEFYTELVKASLVEQSRNSLYNVDNAVMFKFYLMYNSVGTHVHKEMLFDFINRGYNKPLQFFTNGNTTGKVDVTETFSKQLSIVSQKTKIFVHSPYCLNISNPWGNFIREDDKNDNVPWVCKKLIYQLKLGEKCNLKGIVVHCGQQRSKSKKLENGTIVPPVNYEDAVINMHSVINYLGDYASENCPLLLETPAGETGELFWKMEEFVNFMKSLKNCIRNKVQVCVDTCHVFAAGYQPSEYIKILLENHIKIGLIHYNDSRQQCGCKKDQHAPAESRYGFIGMAELTLVLELATLHNIPCVCE
jgi:endonuclease IV